MYLLNNNVCITDICLEQTEPKMYFTTSFFLNEQWIKQTLTVQYALKCRMNNLF